MTNTVIANGNTYTDDGDPNTGMADGGFRERLLPMLGDVMHDTNEDMAAAQVAASAAIAASITAINGVSTTASSASSIVCGLGLKSLVVQTGKTFPKGMFVTLARTSTPSTTWMNGPVESYDPATGAMSMTSLRAQGTVTATDWTVSVSAPASPATGGGTLNGTSVINAQAFKLQEARPSVEPRTYSVTYNNANVVGPALYSFRNRAQWYPWDVLVKTSAQSGFVPAGKQINVDSTFAGFDGPALQPYGSPQLKQITFSGLIGGTGGVWTKSIPLPSGSTAILVHGANLHVVVNSFGGVWTSPLLIRTALSTAGADGMVMGVAINDGTDNILVASVSDTGTALQLVVVTVGGGGLALGTPVPITLGTASTRIVDLLPLVDGSGSGSGLLFVLGLMTTAGTALLTYGLNVTTAGGTAVTFGAVRSDTTVSSVGCLLIDGQANVYTTVTASTATNVAIKGINITGAGVQTVGGTANVTITTGTASSVQVRHDFGSGPEGPRESGPWVLGYIVSGKGWVSKLVSVSGAPSLSAPTAVNSAITTVTGFVLGQRYSSVLAGGAISAAVVGTDASGRFLAELVDFDAIASPMTALSAVTAVAMSAAITAVWVGPGVFDSVLYGIWQLTTTSEALVANSQPNGVVVPNTYRMGNAGGFSHLLQAMDPLAMKSSRHRTTLRTTNSVLATGDGSKSSMRYSLETAHGEPTARPVPAVSSLLFSSFHGDLYTDNAWITAGAAPSVNLLIQNLALVA